MTVLAPAVALLRGTTGHDWYAAPKLTAVEVALAVGFDRHAPVVEYRTRNGSVERTSRRTFYFEGEALGARQRIFVTTRDHGRPDSRLSATRRPPYTANSHGKERSLCAPVPPPDQPRRGHDRINGRYGKTLGATRLGPMPAASPTRGRNCWISSAREESGQRPQRHGAEGRRRRRSAGPAGASGRRGARCPALSSRSCGTIRVRPCRKYSAWPPPTRNG